MPQENRKRIYEAFIALPYVATPPQARGENKIKNRVELRLIGDDFYWLRRIEASNRAEAAKKAGAWFFRTKRKEKATQDLRIEKSLVVTDPYNEVVYKDKLKCCSWNYRLLEKEVIDRLVSESKGRLRKTTRRKTVGHVCPSVEWNTNAKVGRWVERRTILNTGKKYIYYNSLTEKYIARIKIRSQKTIGHKVRIIHDARTTRASGKRVWNNLTLRDHTKGERVQNRKYREFRLEAQNMYEAEKETNKLIEQFCES